MSGTVGKAASLMEQFSEEVAELGLTELARAAGFDKATTRRLCVALAAHGLVEQDPASKRYRLGGGLLRLARIREATFPFVETTKPIAEALALKTGETCHVSSFSGGVLSSLVVAESPRANRVSVEIGERLPLHATASGICILAFNPDSLLNRVLARDLRAHTRHTIVDPDRLRTEVISARRHGFSIGEQGYEDGVSSVAAPIFGRKAEAIGAIAIAAPLARVDPGMVAHNSVLLVNAASRITEALGGREPSRDERLAS